MCGYEIYSSLKFSLDDLQTTYGRFTTERSLQEPGDTLSKIWSKGTRIKSCSDIIYELLAGRTLMFLSLVLIHNQ